MNVPRDETTEKSRTRSRRFPPRSDLLSLQRSHGPKTTAPHEQSMNRMVYLKVFFSIAEYGIPGGSGSDADQVVSQLRIPTPFEKAVIRQLRFDDA